MSPRAVEREHELRDEALTVGVLYDKRLKLAHDLLVPPECEIRIEAELGGSEAKLLENLRGGATERAELDVCKR